MRIKSSLSFIVVLLTLSNSFRRTSGSRARFSKKNYDHGTEERENEIEMCIHEESKQTHDGDGRRSVVKNASYGDVKCFY